MQSSVALNIAHHRHLIGGKAIPASDGRTIDVFCPSDGSVYASIARGTGEDVNAAVRAARNAFDGGEWARISPADRGRILSRMSILIDRDKARIAEMEAKDVGKILRTAVLDVEVLSRYFEFYAGAADKVGGTVIPIKTEMTAFATREPLGVVAAILPWNGPAQMFGRVVAPALAMGNTVVIKAAEDASLSNLYLAELLLEAGLPSGVVNVLTGYGHEAGAALASHPMIDFISFTGSPEVGTLVQQMAAANHVGVTLELGGKSPQVLYADADLSKALPTIIGAIMVNSGQTCSAGSRLLVEKSVLLEVSQLFSEQFQKLVAGRHDDDRDLGPLINAKQRDRVKKQIDAAVNDGIEVLSQGRIGARSGQEGYFVPPTLLGNVARTHRIAQNEVFGPVLALLPFEDEADAIRLANGTQYGLAAGVWTNDIGKAFRTAKSIRAGQVYINNYGAGGGVELPFGGFKKSGHGREKGLEALYEFSTTKTIVLDHR